MSSGKKILLAVLVFFMLLSGAVIYLFSEFTEPRYHLGDAAALDLLPPEQTGDSLHWQVNPEISLYHWERGRGRTVLIVHGGPGVPIRKAWSGLDSLSSQYRFVYYDQRGCGRSSRPLQSLDGNFLANVEVLEKTVGLAQQIGDIERIRRILGEDKLTLIGHSFGGLLATLYAAEFPDRVQSLTLIAPAALLEFPQEDGGLFEYVRAELPESMLGDYDAWLKEYLSYGDLFSHTEQSLSELNGRFVPFYEEAIRARGLSLPDSGLEPEDIGGWTAHAQYLSMGMKHDWRDYLSAVQAPALVIHGGKDLQPEAATRQYADLLPSAEFAVIPEAGHFSFEDRPEDFQQVLGYFLQRH